MNRKIGVLLLALVAVMCLSFGACKFQMGSGVSKEEALQNYIFELEDQVVKDEFTLPRLIGDYRVTWTSDNELVVLEQRKDDYLAKVTIPEEDVTVTLTANLRGVTKEYTIRLQAITVQDIVDAYSFPQNRGTIYEDFELASETTYKGRTATIEWSAPNASYITVEDNVCKVSPSSLNPEVEINATFTYKGVSATMTYRFTVSEKMEHLQEVNYWYNNTGVSITMKGYVVEIATVWSSSYNNVSLYMVDENLDAGYYLYRAGCDAANAAKLKPGVYITCEGTTNTNYNGLIETNAGGTITVDETKTIDLDTTVYAIDNDILAGAPAANYNQSRLVSLTNWKVKEAYKDEPVTGTTATLFTLEKGGKTVSVAVSKYMEGAYLTQKDDAKWTAFVAKYNEIKAKLAAGEEVIVSVKGVMGYYKNPQILPLSVDDIVIGGTVGANDAVIGSTVAKAMASVDNLMKDVPALIADAYSLELPATLEGVTVNYKLLGERVSFLIKDGKLLVVPGAAEIATLQVSFTYEGYTANKFYSFRAEELDDQGRADWEIKNLDVLTEVKAVGSYDLPKTSFFKNAKLAWTTDSKNVTISGNKLIVNSLYFDASKIKLTATVTVGEATSTSDYYISVAAYDVVKPVYVENAPKAGVYTALASYQQNLSKTLYATGELSTYYLATSADSKDAAKLEVIQTKDGFYQLKLGSKFLEIKVADDKTSIVLNKIATEGFVWSWNDEYDTFTTELTGFTTESKNGTYYVGTYGSYNTISASTISYAKTSFPAQLVGEVQIKNAQDVLNEIIGSMEESVTSDFVLDCKADWELMEGSQGIELDGLTAKVTQGDVAQTSTFKATLTYGVDEEGNPVTVTAMFDVTVPSLVYPKISLAEFLALEDNNYNFYTIGGFVKEIAMDKNDSTKVNAYGNIYITDGTTTLYVYGLNAEKMKYDGGFKNQKDFASLGIEVGMYVELVSAKGSYNGNGQALGSGLIGKYEVKTIPEFLALEDSTETFYVVEGTVTKIVMDKNDATKPNAYGNVYIKDADGKELYIYGLNAEKMKYDGGWKNQKDFTSLGIEVGMKITVISAKGSYNGAGQAVGSGLLYKAAGEQGGEEKPVDPTPGGDDKPVDPTEGTKANVVIADYAAANNWENSKIAETCKIDDVVTVTISCTNPSSYGQNTGKYYTNGENWRIYQNETPSILIAAKAGYKILTVKITYASQAGGVITNGSAQVDSDAVITVNAQSITLSVGNSGTAANGQARITAIEVVYTTSDGGDTPVDPTPGEGEDDKPVDPTPTVVPAPQEGTYIYALNQVNLEKTLYATATISGRYLATTEDAKEAAVITLTKNADGKYYLTIGGKYLEVGLNEEGKTAVVLLDTATAGWTWNEVAGVMTFALDGKDYYLGTFNTYNTVSASSTYYITDANASNIGVTQFICYFANIPEEGGETPVDPTPGEGEDDKPVDPTPTVIPAPQEGTYIYALNQVNLEKTLYATATISGRYLATTEDAKEAAVITLTKNADGKYYLTIGGKYLEVGLNEEGKTAVVLLDAATAGWTWNEVAGVMTFALDGKDYYLGTFSTYNTVSASSTYYITDANASNIGVSQFICYFANVPEEGGETPVDPTPGEGEDDKPVDPTPTDGTKANVVIADYADANGWENEKIAETCKIDDVVTVTVSCTNPSSYGQNTGKYYTNGENWRIYQNETPSILIAAKDGYKILTVKITYASQNSGVITNGSAQVDSDAVITVNAQSITLSVGNSGTKTNGQARITAIEVVYTTSDGGDTPVNPNPGEGTFTLEEEKEICLKNAEDDWKQWIAQFGEEKIAQYQQYYNEYTALVNSAKDVDEIDFINEEYTDIFDNVYAVLNGSITTVKAPEEGEYFYVVEQLELKKTLYVTEKIVDGCFQTTTNKAKAAKVVLTKSGEGYVITIGGKYLELVENGEYVDVVLLAKSTGTVWTWNEFYGVMTYRLSDGAYFVEAYEDVEEVVAAHLSYIYNGELGDTDFACQFVAYEAPEGGEDKPVDPTPGEGEDKPVESGVTLDFTDVANRESHAADKQVWKQNGITLVNEKAGNNNDVSDATPIRLYQNSKVIISYKGMTKIVFNCNNGKPQGATALQNSITGATVTVDGLVATVVFAAPVDELVIESLTAQVRLDSLTVYAGTSEGGEDKPVDPTPGEGEVDFETAKAAAIEKAEAQILKIFDAAEAAKLSDYEIMYVDIYVSMKVNMPLHYATTFEELKKVEADSVAVYEEANAIIEGKKEVDFQNMKTLTVQAMELALDIVKEYPAEIANKYVTSFENVIVKAKAVETEEAIMNVIAEYTALVEALDKEIDPDAPVDPTPGEGEDKPVTTITLDLTDKANRESYATDKQVWKQNGITLVNDKAASSTDIGDYAPIRLYKDSKVTVSYKGMTKIVFTCNQYQDKDYVTPLKNSITTGTVTVDGLVVTVVFDAPVDELVIETLTKQVRLDSVTVYASAQEGEDDKPVDPTPGEGEDDKGTKANPYTVQEALNVLETLGETVSEKVYVKGTIAEITYYNEKYSSYTINLVDASTDAKYLVVYGANLAEGITAIYAKDMILVSGYLMNYTDKNGNVIPELANYDGVFPVIEEIVARGTSKITYVADENATVNGVTEGANGTTFTFTVKVNDGYVVSSVKVNNKPVNANEDGSYTATIEGDMTVTVVIAKEGAAVEKATSMSFEFNEQIIEAAGDYTLDNVDWKVETDAGYFGYDNYNGKGQQVGSKNKPATYITFTTSGLSNYKVIGLTAAGASNTKAVLTVKVGGVVIGTANLTSQNGSYSFSVPNDVANYDIEITITQPEDSKLAIYISKLVVSNV